MSLLFYKGINADLDERILILGESHYDDKKNIGRPVDSNYTINVVNAFLNSNKRETWHEFFERVGGAFGYVEASGIKDFYNKIYFGNYITEFCDLSNSYLADKYINDNYLEYNNRLFSYINENEIDALICASKKVYWALPKGNDGDQHFDEIVVNGNDCGKKRTIEKYVYKDGVEHKNVNVVLKKPLLVYGINHPSGSYGFSPKEIYSVFKNEEIFSKIINDGCI